MLFSAAALTVLSCSSAFALTLPGLPRLAPRQDAAVAASSTDASASKLGCLAIKNVPPTVQPGTATGKTVSGACGLDGPMISEVNSQSYDWWYFDAISTDGKQAVTLIFFTATAGGFPLLSPAFPTVLPVYVFGAQAGGTPAVIPLISTSATIVTTGQGSSAAYLNGTSGWLGSPTDSAYTITINQPASGVVGTIKMTSTTPAHYPCGGSPAAGQTLEIVPGVGWANAVPSSTAVVDFTIAGVKYAYTGTGYHDKNWGVQPFAATVKHWYWGRGTIGSYSFVYFDAIGSDGVERVSAYLSSGGKVVSAACTIGSVSVRPADGTAYPPPHGTLSSAITITFTSGGKTLVSFKTTSPTTIASNSGVYAHWVGSTTSTTPAGLTGAISYEQFNLA